ncbi:MAG: HP0495 family protein [Burkholderiales bacterium]
MAVENESLIEYPCDFPIKVLGRTQAGFAQTILEIVRNHAPDFDGSTLQMKTSKHGKYLSVTCVIRASSRQQLDDLYRELCGHPMVVMVL